MMAAKLSSDFDTTAVMRPSAAHAIAVRHRLKMNRVQFIWLKCNFCKAKSNAQSMMICKRPANVDDANLLSITA